MTNRSLPTALEVSQRSWACVQEHDKKGWLSLMADDVAIEDPIGRAPTNPDGRGVRGIAAVEDFYDKFIATKTLTIECLDTFLSSDPREVAHIMRLTGRYDTGVQRTSRGVFTYRVNDEGLLVALRGYWTMEGMVYTYPSEESDEAESESR